MLRISTSHLESFRRVVDTEYGDPAELEAYVKGVPLRDTWQMRAGTAWHSALEGIEPSDKLPTEDGSGIGKWGDYWFNLGTVHHCQCLIGPGVWEMKATRELQVGDTLVNLVAKVDHMHGLEVQEQKTKFSLADERDLEPALQWRVYLYVHGASSVKYNLWSFRDPDGGGYCELKDVLSFRFWPYQDLEADVLEWTHRFISWCRSRGLVKYLEREAEETA